MRKLLVFLAITFAVMFLQGCFTGGILLMAPLSKTVTTIKSSNILAEDQLYAIGRIDNTEILTRHPKAIAMVGRNAVYVVVEGGDRFAEIAQKIDGNRLFSANKFNQKTTDEIPFEIEVSNGSFTGSRRFFYDKPKSELSDVEIEIIKKSTYTIADHGSTLTVSFVGFIPKTQVQVQGTQTNFKVERKIILHQIERQYKTVPNMDAIIGLPFAVMLDSMLLPLEILFFTGVYIDNHVRKIVKPNLP